jgi:hypothetical protein
MLFTHFLVGALASCASAEPLGGVSLNFTHLSHVFEGIGALSGGGGVTRLLLDYDPAIQQDILDILFKPNAGASLQIIKVEIGGDTQSTEGTEESHMHARGDLNCSRGYEWWVVEQAKLRNPAIGTYGLTWGVPGWIGDGLNGTSGGGFYSDDNIDYHLNWLYCAQAAHGVEVDWMVAPERTRNLHRISPSDRSGQISLGWCREFGTSAAQVRR